MTLLHLAAKRFVVGSLQYLLQQKDVHVDQLDGDKVIARPPPLLEPAHGMMAPKRRDPSSACANIQPCARAVPPAGSSVRVAPCPGAPAASARAQPSPPRV